MAGAFTLGVGSSEFPTARGEDIVFRIQSDAVAKGKSDVAYWGNRADKYSTWGSHSNRLIPVYTYGTRGAGQGVDLDDYIGAKSPYRSEQAVRAIYGRVPTNTVHPEADYCDQTNLADIQRAAAKAGKKYTFLVIFDGMDWQTTHAAAIYASGKVGYRSGRGTGLHFLDYTAKGTSQYGWMVTSPHNEGTQINVDTQTVQNPGGTQPGGYNRDKGGISPWAAGSDSWYTIGKRDAKTLGEHAYPDSAATAVAMTSGVKTYNNSINIGPTGEQVPTIAHDLQRMGRSVGAVSSVPVSHATPAAAYAHNVHRDDYQDLTRDMLGLPSISHPKHPLPGMDVVIGGGYGDINMKNNAQGKNFVPGNKNLTDADLRAADVRHGGKYVVAIRTAGVNGKSALNDAAEKAASEGKRLFGFYGNGKYAGHLPFRTANGDYKPAPGGRGAEVYTPADLEENPTLEDMTNAAIKVLSKNPKGFWLMVEAGDVDWANHDNNLDTSIGAVISGDMAIKAITNWVEKNSNWQESLMIVTADHGHYLNLVQPERLVRKAAVKPKAAAAAAK